MSVLNRTITVVGGHRLPGPGMLLPTHKKRDGAEAAVGPTLARVLRGTLSRSPAAATERSAQSS